MQVVVFSAPDNFEGELEIVKQLLKHNIIFHIRKPKFSYEDLYNYLEQIPSEFYPKIVIHQHIKLLNVFKLKGFHCTRYFLAKNEENIKGVFSEYKAFSFSKSCHTLEELKNSNDFDYVFFSPVFKSISKANYESNYQFESIDKAIKTINTPVIALGGITNKNIPQLLKSNFSGCAFLGSIWNNGKPLNNFNRIRALITL